VRMLLACLLSSVTAVAVAAGPAPFTATYDVVYAGVGVGTSELRLSATGGNRYAYESRSTPRGVGRLIVGEELRQRSEFVATSEGIRPLRYVFDDGSGGDKRDVALDFDWTARRVTGTAEGKRVDLAAPTGLQDTLSLQIATMQLLADQRPLPVLAMIEKDRIKEYRYVRERTEIVRINGTAYETVVYRSERTSGGDSYTRLWYAPSIGWLPVKSEQVRKGKVRFALTLLRYAPGG